MDLQEMRDTINNLPKGQFVNATWRSGNNGYEKRSNGVVRLVKYGNIKGVVVKGKVNNNETIDTECPYIYHNSKTKTITIQLSTIKGMKATCKYYYNGIEITKQQYEMVNKPRKPQLDPNGKPIEKVVFRVKLENLLSIGE